MNTSRSEFETCKMEIAINSMLFPKYSENINNNIAKYFEYINTTKDVWLIHEVGGKSLTKQLFDIHGNINNDNR